MGASVQVELRTYVSDPDGDALRYAANSSDESAASVTVAGSVVTIEGRSQGQASVSVTATDPSGLAAQSSFSVTVPNRGPASTTEIPVQVLFVGEEVEVDMVGHFSDPDGDAIQYSVTISNADVASVLVSGSTVMVTGLEQGMAEATVSATDPHGLSAEQTFGVTVRNQGPVATSEIPDAVLFVGEEVEVDMVGHFSDPDGDALEYSVTISDAEVATISVDGSTVMLLATGQGTAEGTVTATDPYDLSVEQSFTVTVPNRAPSVIQEIPEQTVYTGARMELDVSPYFSDVDGDSLAFTVQSSDPSRVAASISGSVLTLTGIAEGDARIAATASDPGELSATSAFRASARPRRTGSVSIRITPATAEVEVGDTLRFSATVTDADGRTVTDPAVTWSTSDPGDAWIREDGLVIGARAAQPTISAAANGATGTAALTVVSPPMATMLRDVRQRHDMVALAGAIVTSAGLVDAAAVGTRSYRALVPVTIYDKWHLGSITKSMTATVAALLIEQGVLEWETTIAAAFPDMTRIHEDLRPVPLEPILAHRGGFTGDIKRFAAWDQMWTSRAPLSVQRRSFASEVLAAAPEFTPLETFHYSNVGYVIVGAMLETATGQEWETLIRNNLFTPLGMHDTGFGAPGVRDAMDQPRGHLGQGVARQPLEPDDLRADNPPGSGPMGTVHATMQDLGRYVSMHLAGALGRETILPSETVKRLHTPAEGFDYASGWFIAQRDWADGNALNHSGTNLHWYAVVWMAPARDFAVLVATNQGGEVAWEAIDEAAGRLIRMHLGR